jgi:three-Cys-motif partner protein
MKNWDYKRQTKIKHAILEKYLWAWLRILGKRVPLLYYIDGFAGKGSYQEKEPWEIKPGSPVIAIKTYLEHKEKGVPYELKFINVEVDEANWQELEEVTRAFKSKADIDNKRGEFLDHIDEILLRIGSAFAFFFIDPFGISGIEFRELERVLARERTEVLLNFSYYGLNRCLGELENLNHPDPKRKQKAERTVQRASLMLKMDREELINTIVSSKTSKEKEISLLQNYVYSLRDYKTYVYPLPLKAEGKESTFYYLIFMTSNIHALSIMKDIMKKEKKAEEAEQLFLPLPEVDMGTLRGKLLSMYEGRVITLEEALKDFLPKVIYFDREDYLTRHIRGALDSLAKDDDMLVTRIPTNKAWNPIYKFGMRS